MSVRAGTIGATLREEQTVRSGSSSRRLSRHTVRSGRGRDEPLRAYCMRGVLATSARRVFPEFPVFFGKFSEISEFIRSVDCLWRQPRVLPRRCTSPDRSTTLVGRLGSEISRTIPLETSQARPCHLLCDNSEFQWFFGISEISRVLGTGQHRSGGHRGRADHPKTKNIINYAVSDSSNHTEWLAHPGASLRTGLLPQAGFRNFERFSEFFRKLLAVRKKLEVWITRKIQNLLTLY